MGASWISLERRFNISKFKGGSPSGLGGGARRA